MRTNKHVSQCPECTSYSEERIEYTDAEKIITFVRCGHKLTKEFCSSTPVEDFTFADGRKPFAFQGKGGLDREGNPFTGALEIIRKEGGSAIVNLKTGRGKTIVAAGALHLWPERFLPAIALCKSGLKMQWAYEIAKLTGLLPQVIETAGDDLLPLEHFPIIIMSQDMLRRVEWLEDIEDEIKTIIVDEVQYFKNMASKRVKHLDRLYSDDKNFLALSATPVKNNADEMYFCINKVAPWRFGNQKNFRHTYIKQVYTETSVKWGGINDYRWDQWKEATQDLIIRYTDSQMGVSLPPVLDVPRFCEPDENYRSDYEEALDKMDELEALAQSEGRTAEIRREINNNIMRMKHIAGLLKVNTLVDMVRDFLEENPLESLDENPDGRYLTLFHHHIDVGDLLEEKIKELCKEFKCNPPMRLYGGNFAGRDEMNETAADFHWVSRNPLDRILIASTLAAGEGWNLQRCAYGILGERQWNDSNERQPLGRFERIGATMQCINFVRMCCMGTLDEFLVEMIGEKREYTSEAMGEEFNEDEIKQEVYGMLLERGRKAWNKAIH